MIKAQKKSGKTDSGNMKKQIRDKKEETKDKKQKTRTKRQETENAIKTGNENGKIVKNGGTV